MHRVFDFDIFYYYCKHLWLPSIIILGSFYRASYKNFFSCVYHAVYRSMKYHTQKLPNWCHSFSTSVINHAIPKLCECLWQSMYSICKCTWMNMYNFVHAGKLNRNNQRKYLTKRTIGRSACLYSPLLKDSAAIVCLFEVPSLPRLFLGKSLEKWFWMTRTNWYLFFKVPPPPELNGYICMYNLYMCVKGWRAHSHCIKSMAGNV